MHICNPNIWGPEAGGAGVLGKPGTHIERLYLKSGTGGRREGTEGRRRGEQFLNLDLSF